MWEQVPWLLLRSIQCSGGSLAAYLASTCTPVEGPASNELWPCPPPFAWRVHRDAASSRRRQQRWRRRRALELLVNLQVVTLSHLALGQPREAPPGGRGGHGLSEAQAEMVRRLWGSACSMGRLGGDLTSCGQRLPALDARLEELHNQLLHAHLVPYSRLRQCGSRRQAGRRPTTVQPVVASRASLPEEVVDFDAVPFLSPESAKGFLNPEHLLDRGRDDEKLDSGGVKTSRGELRSLLLRWDKINRLVLALPEEVADGDTAPVFFVPKDEDRDRQILDRRSRNARERRVLSATPTMPQCQLLARLHLPSQQCLLGSCDDLQDFYHCFKVSRGRALSTPVGPAWRLADFEGTQAAAELLRLHPTLAPTTLVRAAYAGLSMGDHNAVDWAQECHTNLLVAAGARCCTATLRGNSRWPLDDDDYISGVVVDDHIGLQHCPRSWALRPEGPPPLADSEAFERANAAYQAVRLRSSPKKAVRRQRTFRAWGAEVEGAEGLVGPPRGKLWRLMALCAAAGSGGAVDFGVVEGILGSLAFVFQFRRPLFALLYDLYHVLPPEGARATTPFRLARGPRKELPQAAVLAPFSIGELVCDYVEEAL